MYGHLVYFMAMFRHLVYFPRFIKKNLATMQNPLNCGLDSSLWLRKKATEDR
jgi:hypothetical protein